MAATRLTNGLAGRTRGTTPAARRARRSAGLFAVVGGGTLALGMLAVPARGVPDAPAASAALTSSGRSAAGGTTLGRSAAPAGSTCALRATGTSVKHVIYIQFDNVHYTRDNPNVPSDLQQMPNLLNFITGNGTLISHEHTPLIAHTADDIVTSETGLYGSDQGVPIANEYNYFTPSGSTDTAGSFAYWTDPIVDYDTGLASKPVADHTPTMIDAQGKNTPAPWVS